MTKPKAVRVLGPILMVLAGWTGAYGDNAVVVQSQSVPSNATNAIIPVVITNDIPLREVLIPLVVRSVSGGAFVDSLGGMYAERLLETPGSPISEVSFVTHYAGDGGSVCKGGGGVLIGPGGFGSPTYEGRQKRAANSSPVGIQFTRIRIAGSGLPPGADSTGSILLTVDVGAQAGVFEIDSSCSAPGNHLDFLEDRTNPSVIVPAFTKGVITVVSACDCSSLGDLDDDGHITFVDLVYMIATVWSKKHTPRSDAGCPVIHRGDVNCDGIYDLRDVVSMIRVLTDRRSHFCNPCE